LASIIFPLRTNIHSLQKWGKNDISRRIKQSIILYDEIVVEAGTYDFQGSDTFVLENFRPWNEQNTKEKAFESLERIRIAPEEGFIKVFDGKTHAEKSRHKVNKKNWFFADFRTADVVSEISSESYGKEVDFFRYLFVDRADAHWKEVRNNSLKDLADRNFAKQVEKTHGKMPTVGFLNNLNDSLVISHRLSTPIAIDSIYSSMLRQRTKAQLSSKFSVLERISNVGFPDFGDLGLEDLLKLRKDKGLQSFRSLISKFSTEIQSDSRVNVESQLIEEMLKISKEFAPTKKKLALDISAGIISFVPCLLANIATTIADIGKGVTEYRAYSKTWVSFIQNAKEL
jgi:hypothetical protein